jgi:hypothetical protein
LAAANAAGACEGLIAMSMIADTFWLTSADMICDICAGSPFAFKVTTLKPSSLAAMLSYWSCWRTLGDCSVIAAIPTVTFAVLPADAAPAGSIAPALKVATAVKTANALAPFNFLPLRSVAFKFINSPGSLWFRSVYHRAFAWSIQSLVGFSWSQTILGAARHCRDRSGCCN